MYGFKKSSNLYRYLKKRLETYANPSRVRDGRTKKSQWLLAL